MMFFNMKPREEEEFKYTLEASRNGFKIINMEDYHKYRIIKNLVLFIIYLCMIILGTLFN